MDDDSDIVLGELGVDAATCAMWDASVLPPTFQLEPRDGPPPLPTAFVAATGDDIDGLIVVRHDGDGDITFVQIEFVDDIADLPASWALVGELHLPQANSSSPTPTVTQSSPTGGSSPCAPGAGQPKSCTTTSTSRPSASRGYARLHRRHVFRCTRDSV